MKKGIALALAIFSSSVFADPAIFGMELGKMTEKDLKAMYNVNHTGTNNQTKTPILKKNQTKTPILKIAP